MKVLFDALGAFLVSVATSRYISNEKVFFARQEIRTLVEFSADRIKKLFAQFKNCRVGVLGDLMLDRYYWGSIARISPEAPVPVVEVESQSVRLGGAANVANNIASLGGTPYLIGVVGDDGGGKRIRGLVEEAGFPTSGLIVDRSRPTTTKTRVIAHHQHVVRIDHEVKEDVGKEVRASIIKTLKDQLPRLDAIILEDYNKGVIVKELIHEISSLTRKAGKVITVDPKFHNFFEYRNVTVFKPNRKETEEALGRRLIDNKSIEQAGWELVERLGADNVLLTLGEQGMSLFERGGEVTYVSTRAKKVADVSGAGDTVISTLTMALVAGATIREASALANHAGGVVCAEVGIVPIQPGALEEAVLETRSKE